VHNAEPSDKGGVIDIYSTLGQHLLQLTVANAVFTVPADCPQDDVTLKMPAFKWVHVLLLQLNSGIKFTIAKSLQQCPQQLKDSMASC
jgi:hypothetical protein